jgi:hypothetical protein
MKRIIYLLLLLIVIQSCGDSSGGVDEFAIEGQTADGFEDGTYCADVTYDNPNTGTSSDYTLDVEVQGNQVTQINWGNGGWLDEDHFNSEELDENGSCSFSSDKGYDYTVTIIGQSCGNSGEINPETDEDLPRYTFMQCAQIIGMTQKEIDKCLSENYSMNDVLSQNSCDNLERYITELRAINEQYQREVGAIYQEQNKMQNEIKNGYVQSIKRSTAYGNTNQIIVISKNGVNYTLEVRGSQECTMGTAQFNENSYDWQMVYIKQYPNKDSYSGHYMRIIE